MQLMGERRVKTYRNMCISPEFGQRKYGARNAGQVPGLVDPQV